MIDWGKSAELNDMPIDELKAYFSRYPQSHKEVVRICDGCGEDRILQFGYVVSLCHSCKMLIEETRQNLSKARRDISDKTRQKMSVAAQNRPPITEETRKRMSDVKIGQFRSAEYRKNISLAKLGEKNGMFGKKAPRSDEDRMRISAGHQCVSYDDWTGFSDNDWREWDKAVYLNDPFPGCQRHHLTKTIVACIPDELHKHIPHNMRTAQGMAEMNMLALQFIHGCYDNR